MAQTKPRSTKARGPKRTRKVANVWPFGRGQLLGPRTTVRHVRSGVKSTSNVSYKGHMIYKRGDGFEVPSIDRDSVFDTKRDAKRFIDSERKASAWQFSKNPCASKKNVVTPAMLSSFSSLVPGQKLTPAIAKRIGREYDRVANPSAGAFEKCVKAVAASGRASSPRGVCAAAGRKKYGKRKFQAMAAAGKRKAKRSKNPVDAAAATYEKFHGRGPDEVIEVVETIHEHGTLSGIGELVSLTVHSVDGKHDVKLSNFKGALLAQNEQATQLFIVGGDQAVNLADFGIIGRPHETEVLGAAVEVAYKTRKDHLGAGGGAGERAIHVHDFGSLRQVDGSDPRRSKGSRLPIVTYDTRNKKLVLAGGGYDLPDVGIRG